MMSDPCGGSCVTAWFFFFFQAEDGIRDLTVTGVQTCALPISSSFSRAGLDDRGPRGRPLFLPDRGRRLLLDPHFRPGDRLRDQVPAADGPTEDRKSTRLNSSHSQISYAVFCLKTKTKSSRSSA